MFWRQTVIEFRKTLAHPALWLGLLGLIALLAGFILIQHAQIASGYDTNSPLAQGGLEQDLIAGLTFYTWIASLVYAVSAAVIVAFDYPDRSIQVWLVRGLPRPTLLLARLAVVLIYDWVLVCFAVVSTLGLAAASRLFFFGRVDAAQVNWIALVPAAFSLFWSSLPYLALAVLLAVLSRSPVFSAAGTIVYASLLERLLGGLLSGLPERFAFLARYLPAQLGSVLQATIFRINLAALPQQPVMPAMRATLMIGLLFLALSSASLILFSRQDLGG